MNSMNGPVTFSKDELDSALYHAVDIMGRCLCPFILLGETARSIIEDDELKGEGIYLGVKENCYTKEVESMMRTIASNVDLRLGVQDFQEVENGLTWVYRGIPISIQIIKRNYGFLQNFDNIFYMAEEYKIPNPFTDYWKIRSLVK
jgi:hypothetical protein